MALIFVSKCLLGYRVRYNGEVLSCQRVLSLVKGHKVITFCPEEILGVPRPKINLFGKDKVMVDERGRVVEGKLRDYWRREFFSKAYPIELFILKAKSPSCALKSAKWYLGGKVLRSCGKFTQKLLEIYKDSNFLEV